MTGSAKPLRKLSHSKKFFQESMGDDRRAVPLFRIGIELFFQKEKDGKIRQLLLPLQNYISRGYEDQLQSCYSGGPDLR